jgi:TolB-like protein/Tfp pilus assembly protein PilF
VSFIEELKRRNVVRVAIAYIIVAWLTAQVADLVIDNIAAPDWLMQAILLVLGLGLPLALFFAWAFELTPDGLKKEKDVDRTQSITNHTGRKLDYAIIGVLVVALGYFAYDKFVQTPGSEVELIVAESQDEIVNEELVEEKTRGKSIAVLPFANRSNREEDEFFTEGMHDDLLTHLAKIGSLKVISRTSVLRYKDTKKSIPEIATELNVATIMEGGIQRSGDQVRINVQLIDAQTDEHLWAEIYDRELTVENLFAIQSEISTAIADALEATLSPEDKSRLDVVPTVNMAAYNAYLRGRQLQTSRKSDDLEEALTEFTRATELDPNYALAWVGMAETYHLLGDYSTLSPGEAVILEDQAVNKALKINDQLGEAYASLASGHIFRGDYEQAEEAFKKAIELSPNYASAYQWYAGLLSGMPDRIEESLALTDKAAELDPLSSIILANHALRLASLGRYEESQAEMIRVTELDPDFAISYNSLASLYSQQGEFAKALQWSKMGREKDPGNIQLIFNEIFFNLNLGIPGAIDSLQELMREIDPDSWAVGAADVMRSQVQGNFDGAIEGAGWVGPKVGNNPGFQQFTGFLHALNGDYKRARELIVGAFPDWEDPAKWPKMIQSNTNDACWIAGVLGRSGDQSQSESLLDMIIQYHENMPSVVTHVEMSAPIMECWVIKGDYGRALDVLETRVAHNHIGGWWGNFKLAWWDDVRSEPRFQTAMDTIADRVEEQRALVEEPNLAL